MNATQSKAGGTRNASDLGVCAVQASLVLQDGRATKILRIVQKSLVGYSEKGKKTEQTSLRCAGCNYSWIAKYVELPERCPACHRADWQRSGVCAERAKLQAKALYIVRRAVKAGQLQKLDGTVGCTDCRASATGYDHRDYSCPLVVEPVCASCNVRRGPAKPYPRALVSK